MPIENDEKTTYASHPAVQCSQETRLGSIEAVLGNISETLKELKTLLTNVARQEERINSLQKTVHVLQEREYEAAKQSSSFKWIVSLVQAVVIALCVAIATLTFKKGGG